MQNLVKQSNKQVLFGVISFVCSGLFSAVAMADKQDGTTNEMNGNAKNAVYVVSSSATTERKSAKAQSHPEEKEKSEIGGYTMEDEARQGAYGDGEYAN